MTNPTRILVPLDGSALARQALPYARALVGDTGRITLLWVTTKPTAIHDAAGIEIVPEDIAGEWILKEARSYLDGVARDLRLTLPGDAMVDTLVLSGDPAETILRAADDRQAAFIVMTSHARGAVGRAAYGSVADRVARSADIPVVITRPTDDSLEHENPAIHRVIVPLDRSQLSREAIPTAKTIAHHLGCSIHLVHVIDNFSSFMANTGVPVSQATVDEWYADSMRELKEIEGDLRATGIQATSAIYQGSTSENLCEMANPDDLIVMTSHGRSGISRWFLGSVAEKLVRLAPVPVCLVPTRRASTTALGESAIPRFAHVSEL